MEFPQLMFLPRHSGLFTVDSILRLDECQSVLDDWTAALLKDARVSAAWPVVGEAIQRLELWKLQQKTSGKPMKLAPAIDASAAAFASHFKSLVREQTVPEGIPFAVPYDKIKPPVLKHVQKIRGKLNVPRERFHLTADGRYRVAKSF